jgi:ferredoxin-NADP reductase
MATMARVTSTSSFSLVATMTQIDQSRTSWTGERGRLAQPLLTRHLTGLKSPIYYIVGPPGMVNGLHRLLTQTGVDHDDTRTEDFSGY